MEAYLCPFLGSFSAGSVLGPEFSNNNVECSGDREEGQVQRPASKFHLAHPVRVFNGLGERWTLVRL